MNKLQLIIVLVLLTTIVEINAEKSTESDQDNSSSITRTYGLGLPRDIDKLAPPDSAYPQWQTEQYPGVDPERLKQVVADLSAFALEDKAIHKFWGRLPGTEADRKSMTYISEKLSKLGYQVSARKTIIPKEWKPINWSMSYSAGDKRYSFNTVFPSGSGMRKSASVNAEAIWLGLGSEADFLGRDVKGKVAVIYSMFVPGGRSHSASNRSKLFYANKRASERGAALIVNIMGVPGNAQFMPAPHYLTRGTVITPMKVPVVTVSQDEGFALRDDLGKGKVDIHFDSQWLEQTNLEANYLVADLPGKSEEEILIAAHTDGYFQGALDNAAGVAVALEMAQHYVSLPEPPARSIKLFFFSDHHHGEFTRREFIESHDWQKVALVLTVEHPSQTQLYWYNDGLMTSNAIGAFRWNVVGSDRLKNLVQDGLREHGISTYTLMDGRPKFTRKAPGFHIIDHVIYHTTLDIPELVPVEGMLRATRSFLSIVDQVNQLPIAELK